MHYSPRIWPERDPKLRLIFLSPASATPGRLRRPACLRPTTGRVGQGAGEFLPIKLEGPGVIDTYPT